MKYSLEQKKELLRKFEIYRLDNRLSMNKAAKLMGVNVATISRWENLEQMPHKVQCYQIKKIVKNFVPKEL